MTRSLTRLGLSLVLLVVTSAAAFAQGASTSPISGTVVDSGGGVIPGATVVVAAPDGSSFHAVTNGEGAFVVPALNPGTYKVTVTLQGFKTAVVNNVRVAPNTPATVKVLLEVGTLSETVTVTSSNELVNTQTATVASTLNSDQLNRMPTPTRNALNAVTFLPGVNTTGINRDSTINGLPESMINITLDGVSNNDNYIKNTDGFFASVTPRQDAIEAVTVTTAVASANMGGAGGVTINFATRSGTNRFTGSTYEYWRDPSLNSNNWLNERNSLPKNDVKLNQYGVRAGGPIVVPGLYDGRSKAFYFFHYEQLRFPNNFTRTRTTYADDTLNGWFLYNTGSTVTRVNVLQLAAANNQLTSTDPTIMAELNMILAATKKTGVVNATTNPLLNSYVWQSPGRLFEHQPTIKLDYNITPRNRVSGSFQEIWAHRDPDYLNSADARFPGAPNYRKFDSSRPLWAITLRSTLSQNIVNELRGGITAAGGSSSFGNPSSNGPQTFQDLGGNALVLPLATDWWTENGPSSRSGPAFNIDNSVTWQRGSHSLNFGGSWLTIRGWDNSQQMAKRIDLGFNSTNDPANGMFNTTNFPGASTTNLNDARAVYAMLTGRISLINGQAALDPSTTKYVPLGVRRREGTITTWSSWLQDSWRVSPGVTLTGGLRWDVQTPFSSLNDTMSAVTMTSVCGQSGFGDGGTFDKCNFYDPGSNTGAGSEYIQLNKGTKGYDVDWNNLAPTVGAAWQPNVQHGFMRAILGDPSQATLRGGYSVAYERQALTVFTSLFGGNPGSTLTLNRNANNNNLVLPGQTWPILLRETNRLDFAPYPETVSYPTPVRASRADSLNAFAPDIQIASARTWTVSFQRSISRDMAVDIRYVGTRGVNQWSALNYNTRNLEYNGFSSEFKLAMANLIANNIAGGTRAGSFAYFGAGTGTNPLPTYLAYINGSRDALNSTAYGGTTWTSTALTQDMVRTNPNVGNSAADLDGDSGRRASAIAAGIPANYFVVNPAVNAANVTDSGAFSDYHALQIDMRRRLSRGLSASLNYQYAIEGGSTFLDFRLGRVMDPSNDVRHAIKTQWDWTLPVGRGQRFGANMPGYLDAIVGGWSFNGVGRIQASMVDFGAVRLVGMSKKDLQTMYKHDIRIDPVTGLKTVYMLPDDIILNTRRAFSTSPSTIDGYSTTLGAPQGRYFAPASSENCVEVHGGECTDRTLLIRAPWFTRVDVGVTKKFNLAGKSNVEVRIDVLNLFDNINFSTPTLGNTPSSATLLQTTGIYQDSSNTYDPGGRLGQLMVRFNW